MQNKKYSQYSRIEYCENDLMEQYLMINGCENLNVLLNLLSVSSSTGRETLDRIYRLKTCPQLLIFCLCQRGINIYDQSLIPSYKSVLHGMIHIHNRDMIVCILDQFVDADIEDAFLLACQRSNIEIVKLLAEYYGATNFKYGAVYANLRSYTQLSIYLIEKMREKDMRRKYNLSYV